jgi:hypothetical protein
MAGFDPVGARRALENLRGLASWLRDFRPVIRLAGHVSQDPDDTTD